MKKTITLLGSTGSIGRQTADVVRKSKEYEIIALAAGENVREAEKQAREFRPRLLCMGSEEAARDLRTRLADLEGIRVLGGQEGLRELIQSERPDIFAISIGGMAALRPTLWAIESGARIALSNKESIVTAGHIMMDAVERSGAELIPVDSEHSAVFQCLQGEDRSRVRKLLITASGGPFRLFLKEELAGVTPQQALQHPNWSMGAKITIDSSTLVNKGLEVMEAHHLFGMSYDRIQVVVHPQSIIHSMVEYSDGSVKAQLGLPDMRLPIEYALGYPRRGELITEEADFWNMPALTFEKPSFEKFPALGLAYEAGRAGGILPTVFNTADELAVADFLAGRISYPAITERIADAMAACRNISDPTLDDILAAERELREKKK